MKLFSIISNPPEGIVSNCATYSGPVFAGFRYDRYPEILAGIKLDREYKAKLGKKTITATSELLAQTGAYVTNDNGITVLRASFRVINEEVLLIPEQDGDSHEAGVLLGFCRCDYTDLRYVSLDHTAIARDAVNDGVLDRLFFGGGYKEFLLAQLDRNQSVLVVRCSPTFFGISRMESIVVCFDGNKVGYERSFVPGA